MEQEPVLLLGVRIIWDTSSVWCMLGVGASLDIFFLFDLQASWDISSDGCLDQLGYYFY